MPGGKVGGVADVIRDLPIALTDKGWLATIVTPSYGVFHELENAERHGTIDVRFRGEVHAVEVYEVPGKNPPVQNIVLEHPLFSPQGPGRIYCNDPPGNPFATDADKFAFFGAALASWLWALPQPPDVLHLHDWHTGFYSLLAEFDPAFEELRDIHTVFSIHNLAYQGIRPFAGVQSSLENWYPGLRVDIGLIRDPRWADCFNALVTAIRLADRVSTVSPTYAKEICLPSDPFHGFIGGEGLEADLSNLSKDGRLVGILNGCEYPEKQGRRPAWGSVVKLMREQVGEWLQQGKHSEIHELAAERIASLDGKRPRHVMVSVGRLVSQKVSLFLKAMPDGDTALQHMLDDLGPEDVLLLLGSGEAELEQQMLEVARRCPNLVFLRGYSEQLADPLYRVGDLFLMPSSFEPCGISQMLAMRVGMPCVVHGVGGLRDTVEDGVTGFVFYGMNPIEQASDFVAAVEGALQFKDADPTAWKKMCIAAVAKRFDWGLSAQRTIDELYDA